MKHSRSLGDMVPYERPIDRPAPVVDGKVGGAWTLHRPDTTLTGDARAFGPHSGGGRGENQSHNTVRITLAEALILQGFPPDYPVQGTKTARFTQVGNAIPPPLAAAIIGTAQGGTP